MKRFLSMFTALFMLVIALAGCGGTGGSKVSKAEDPNTVPEDSYQINWFLMAESQQDVHSVEEAINEYIKDKINATVKLNLLPTAQYQQKVGMMINANEYFDLGFVARWMLAYVDNSRAGAFVALDDYLDTYLKGAASQFDEGVLDNSRVDGKLYALPVNKEMATQYGWIYRKDLAEKYNIDMTQYKTFTDLEPVLQLIKENEPEINYPIDWAKDTAPAALLQFENFIFKDGTYPDDKAMNVFDVPEYYEACETAHDFYTKGYVRPDVLTATDQLQRMNEGKTFVMLSAIKPGKAQELFNESGYEFDQAEVTEPIIDYLSGTGSMQAISASSKNPERVARFLNLVNTDPYLKNLIVYGIEGKHYNKIDSKTVDPIPDSGYSLNKDSWTIGNVFNDYLLPTDDPNKLEDLKAFNKRAKTSRVNQFLLTLDDDAQHRASEISTVMNKYRPQCATGAVEPGPAIKEFNDQLEKVGLTEHLEYIQKQYDDFLKKTGQ